MIKLKRIKIGDVFEINTPKGNAYVQYIYNNTDVGELIRVLQGVYSNQPSDLSTIVNEKELYLVHFPLKPAVKQGIVKQVGNFDLPKNFELPKKMRAEHIDGNWHIVDYETWQRQTVKLLSDEQKKLSPWEIWNDTLLIERISEGWTLDKWI